LDLFVGFSKHRTEQVLNNTIGVMKTIQHEKEVMDWEFLGWSELYIGNLT